MAAAVPSPRWKTSGIAPITVAAKSAVSELLKLTCTRSVATGRFSGVTAFTCESDT